MPRKPSAVDYRLLNKVSKYYYEEGLKQEEIAEKLFLSRPKVSRLLQQAQNEGIVNITVISPPDIHQDTEDALEKKFSLQEAVVIESAETDSQHSVSTRIGQAAAEYFIRTLRSGDRIGISWGVTLSAMVRAIAPQEIDDVHIVQLIGGLGYPELEMHATNLCQQISRLLSCRLSLLPAPGVVDSKTVKSAILSDSHIRQTFNLFDKVNVAYVGIGSMASDAMLTKEHSIVSKLEQAELEEKNAVGNIAMRFFDPRGEPVSSELDERVIGIEFDRIKKIKRVVGLAGGPQKIELIRAALIGKLINVLVTDYQTAVKLLAAE